MCCVNGYTYKLIVQGWICVVVWVSEADEQVHAASRAAYI